MFALVALEKGGADYEAVNVGTGKPTSILEVAEVLRKQYGAKVAPTIEHKFRFGDVRHCVADISNAHRLLGNTHQVSFAEGMREVVAWGQGASAADSFDKAYEEMKDRGLLEG